MNLRNYAFEQVCGGKLRPPLHRRRQQFGSNYPQLSVMRRGEEFS